jgi:hypothetical protein
MAKLKVAASAASVNLVGFMVVLINGISFIGYGRPVGRHKPAEGSIKFSSGGRGLQSARRCANLGA